MDLGKALRIFLHWIEDLVYPRGINCLVCGDRRRTDPATGVCPGCLKKLEAERVPAAACPRCLSFASRKGCAFCARCDNAMKICLTEIPEELWINDNHKAACWLNVRDAFEGREAGK